MKRNGRNTVSTLKRKGHSHFSYLFGATGLILNQWSKCLFKVVRNGESRQVGGLATSQGKRGKRRGSCSVLTNWVLLLSCESQCAFLLLLIG